MHGLNAENEPVRYTSISVRDPDRAIVQLVRIAARHGGMVPQDGQYVPSEVIQKLFEYEQAEAEGRLVIKNRERAEGDDE